MATMDPESTVARIATERPASIPVFHRHRIDFCCGGRQPLGEACRDAGISTDRFLDEVRAEEARTTVPLPRWDDASLDALIDHILTRYHRPLDEALPRIVDWAVAVQRAHGDHDPEYFRRLLQNVLAVRDEISAHMIKEEQVVFPWIRGGSGSTAGEPLGVLIQEHETLGRLLDEIRSMTNDFQVPDDACTTWRALWEALETLENDCHEHIHLENNVLFPRALAGVSCQGKEGGIS